MIRKWWSSQCDKHNTTHTTYVFRGKYFEIHVQSALISSASMSLWATPATVTSARGATLTPMSAAPLTFDSARSYTEPNQRCNVLISVFDNFWKANRARFASVLPDLLVFKVWQRRSFSFVPVSLRGRRYCLLSRRNRSI